MVSSLDQSPVEQVARLSQDITDSICQNNNKLPKWFGPLPSILVTYGYLHDSSVCHSSMWVLNIWMLYVHHIRHAFCWKKSGITFLHTVCSILELHAISCNNKRIVYNYVRSKSLVVIFVFRSVRAFEAITATYGSQRCFFLNVNSHENSEPMVHTPDPWLSHLDSVISYKVSWSPARG